MFLINMNYYCFTVFIQHNIFSMIFTYHLLTIYVIVISLMAGKELFY